jgi:hypothetical protein
VLDVHAVLEHIVGDAVANVVALDGDVDVDGDFGIFEVDAGETIAIGLATWFVSWAGYSVGLGDIRATEGAATAMPATARRERMVENCILEICWSLRVELEG